MKKPIKVTNQRALKKWDDYVNALPNRQAALLPLDVDIDKGKIYRSRISGAAVARLYKAHKKGIPDFMNAFPEMTPTMTDFPNLDKVVQHYVDNINDGSQTPPDITPLDIQTNRPTYMLFRLSRRDIKAPPAKYLKWRFSEDKQITCHNDGVGPFLNVMPICTLDDGKILLAYNRHRSNPPKMKYDLHVTIEQKVKIDGKTVIAKTPIIIDPGFGNKGSDLP